MRYRYFIILFLLLLNCTSSTKTTPLFETDNQPLSILIFTDPLLSQKSSPIKTITPKTQMLIKKMYDLIEQDRYGALSAVQVGHLKRLFVIKFPDQRGRVQTYTFINPEITHYSKTTVVAEERCLSFPGLFRNVERSLSIEVKAKNQLGESFSLSAEGLFARIIQHEMDHLDGIVPFND